MIKGASLLIRGRRAMTNLEERQAHMTNGEEAAAETVGRKEPKRHSPPV